MTNAKQQYLHAVRSDTAYPVYRGFIGLIALLGFALAGLIGLGALIGGIAAMSQSFILGLLVIIAGGVFAALVYLLAKFYKEAALVLVDIGDSIAEANSRESYRAKTQ